MSEPVSALKNVAYTSGIADVSEVGPVGMITLRGDLSAPDLQKSAVSAAGVKLPGQREMQLDGDSGMAWMAPDELMILCPYDQARDKASELADKLADTHALAVNVSDARAVFEVSGPQARFVLAKLAPVDMAQFGEGDFRRTRMAQVPAAIWMVGEDRFRIMCFRSVAQYMFDLLSVAAQPGSEVASL